MPWVHVVHWSLPDQCIPHCASRWSALTNTCLWSSSSIRSGRGCVLQDPCPSGTLTLEALLR
jgi:hypothetical protein